MANRYFDFKIWISNFLQNSFPENVFHESMCTVEWFNKENNGSKKKKN